MVRTACDVVEFQKQNKKLVTLYLLYYSLIRVSFFSSSFFNRSCVVLRITQDRKSVNVFQNCGRKKKKINILL